MTAKLPLKLTGSYQEGIREVNRGGSSLLGMGHQPHTSINVWISSCQQSSVSPVGNSSNRGHKPLINPSAQNPNANVHAANETSRIIAENIPSLSLRRIVTGLQIIPTTGNTIGKRILTMLNGIANNKSTATTSATNPLKTSPASTHCLPAVIY